jgi:hypothetical protein
MTAIQEWFEQYNRRVRDEGRGQAIARLFARRLGRPLAEAERRVLAERIERLGEDRVDDVLLESSDRALAAWLADPAAS